MLAVYALAWSVSVTSADVQAGDKVVTLTVAPVMSGEKKLTEVQPGVELTAAEVQGPWVKVTVAKDGEEISGWILERNLVADPGSVLSALLGLYEEGTSQPELQNSFQSMDGNVDGALSAGEFVAATKLDTLDDLNRKLQGRLSDLRKTITVRDPKLRTQGILLFLAGEMSRLKGLKKEMTFGGWKRIPTQEEAKAMAEEFLRSGDIRRSRVAQQLVQDEAPDARARKAQSLFKWADGNSDNRLSLQEFKRAVSTQPAKGSVGQNRSRPSENGDLSVRGEGAGSSERAGLGADILRLIEGLEDKSSTVRARAVDALKEMGQDAKEAVPALARALQDENSGVRSRAAKALGAMGGDAKEAVPSLARALQDETSYVRVSAAMALEAMGSNVKGAVSALGTALQDEEYTVRVRAAKALANLGSDAKAAAPALIKALEDESSSVRASAKRALDAIRSEQH